MLLLLKSSIVNFTFCTTSRYDKYSKHVNSSEIDRDKQNKILVRRKRMTTGNLTKIEPSYLTPISVPEPKTCVGIEKNSYFNRL